MPIDDEEIQEFHKYLIFRERYEEVLDKFIGEEHKSLSFEEKLEKENELLLNWINTEELPKLMQIFKEYAESEERNKICEQCKQPFYDTSFSNSFNYCKMCRPVK